MDDFCDLVDFPGGGRGGDLDFVDLIFDVESGGCGLFGKFFNLVGDDGKALAGFSRPGGFDGGIQGQKVGLLRYLGNRLRHLIDRLGRLAQFGDFL